MGNLLTVEAGSADVEAMMHSVATELEQWAAPHGLVAAAHPAAACRENPTREIARRLQLQANVDGRAIIHSTRPRLGPWLIRFQTVMRRLTWWFLEPVLQQVRAFQTDAAQAIAKLSQEQEALQAQVSELRALLQQTGATGNSDQREKPGTVEDGNAGQS